MIQKINYEFTDNGAAYESTIGNKTSEITKEEYEKIPDSHGGQASISVSSLEYYVSKNLTISAYIEGKKLLYGS